MDRHLHAAALRGACRGNRVLQRACGKGYWRTLCCIIATARVPEACVTWSQRKNVQMGSMRQCVSLCSNALLQLAKSLEKRGGGKKRNRHFAQGDERRKTKGNGEITLQSSILLFRGTVLRQTTQDFFLFLSRFQLLLPGVCICAKCLFNAAVTACLSETEHLLIQIDASKTSGATT